MYISSPLTLGLLGFAGTSNALMTKSSGTYESLAHARYHLVDTYNSKNIFNDFNFFDGADPTHGFVSYQNKSSASRRGLISTANGQAYMGVDHTTVNPPFPGRASVRLESKKAYNHGLFITDIAHMPGSICGDWPAWWLFGPNWPNNGEIDIIEEINRQGTNIMTLHTSPGCSIDTAGSQNGTILQSSDCNFKNANNGCGATTSTENAYGDSFNRNGGGVYAMQCAKK
ncbi:related to mixed-linked glucanase precursor MLG1 [Rhynchosporium agropyri]|uniref:Related to mixed-linked glucanase MLG1 n=1 Tax=Rhynchosporium agropyri TaxID=914238 RepID=A0A1E1LQ72_9HELO|nr:related to mixed-linked glucanase precursor MLG1 [Rhynchosporium agropyri]